MIIIKIISLYFIEIAHTDDFPSTGIQLVSTMRHTDQPRDFLNQYKFDCNDHEP